MTPAQLAARLALVERLHRVELEAARDAYARAAAALVRGKSHDLGNSIQIMQLGSLEVEKRGGLTAEIEEIIVEMRNAADRAAAVLGELLAAARPTPRTHAGPPVAAALHAGVELARAALATPVELAITLPDDVRTLATQGELEALAAAALLAAADAGATKIDAIARPRAIGGKPWLSLIVVDDRALETEPQAPPLVVALAERVGGEASIAPGRHGVELAVELPVVGAAAGQSSSSS